MEKQIENVVLKDMFKAGVNKLSDGTVGADFEMYNAIWDGKAIVVSVSGKLIKYNSEGSVCTCMVRKLGDKIYVNVLPNNDYATNEEALGDLFE